MKNNYLPSRVINVGALAILMLLCSFVIAQTNPLDPALNFNIFVENGATLKTNETEGPIAIGGDLTLNGSYVVAAHTAGDFKVGGLPIGLLINGKVNYHSGSGLYVNNNGYVKIGNGTGSVVWYKDPNNATPPIRVTPNSNYNSSPAIMLQTGSNNLGVSASNNPVIEGNLIDFSAAFQQMRNSALDISKCKTNASLTNPNGQPIPTTNLPNQVKINLNDGVNVLNVTGSDLNNVSVFTFNNKPSASKILIVNVDAAGTFNWNVWNQAGIAFNEAKYILYNFYNTTKLNIVGNSTVEGTVFAPFADIDKSVNQSNIEGQVIGKSLIHSGGEMHHAKFDAKLSSCGTSTPPPVKNPPTADFKVNNKKQCIEGNSFKFTNTSTDNGTKPTSPLTYKWDFGDATGSTKMNPTKVYSTAGNYTVTLITKNAHGADTTTMDVVVYASTAANVSVQTTATGNGSVTKEYTLNNSSSFTSFAWILPGTTTPVYANQKKIDITFTKAGYYQLKVVATNKKGCVSTTIVPIVIESSEVTTGNNGGVESHSLGDAISKVYINRKKNSIPSFATAEAISFEKETYTDALVINENQSLLDMFPEELMYNDKAVVSSPTDILDYTIAEEVLSVDYSIDGQTKGVVLGIRTMDRVYNHTKASCDRLRGAEILSIETKEIGGHTFLMQVLEQRNGAVEYAVSFSIGKDENAKDYSLQSNWFVNDYIASKDVYNFQVWSTNPEYTEKLVVDILENLNSFLSVNQIGNNELPKTYISKITRVGAELKLKLKSIEDNQSIEIVMDENHSETNGYGQRYSPMNSEKDQIISIDVNDIYEFEGLVNVNGETQDAFYSADGNWGLDFDSRYTRVNKYVVSNSADRVYNESEFAINRNVDIDVYTDHDYLILYKSLLPAQLPDDYTDYKFVSFKASGSGLVELGLVKSSIQDWKNQYKGMVYIAAEEETYYIPFEYFKSLGYEGDIVADDLTLLTFTFLADKANSNKFNLKVSDVKFTKTAPAGYNKFLVTDLNQFEVYPNPTEGQLNCLLISDTDSDATLALYDISGRLVYSEAIHVTEGRNEFKFSIDVEKGLFFMNIVGPKVNFGTSKVIFR